MNNILKVDSSGKPVQWISWEEAVYLQCSEKVKWSMGDTVKIARSGENRITGKQTIIEIPAILAADGRDKSTFSYPNLTNRSLYKRDKHRCCYCGEEFSSNNLSIDHIIPVSRGGKHDWMNVVTACKTCNNKKGNYLLNEINMKQLFKPYIPSHIELLLRSNENMHPEQYQYILSFLKG